MQQGWYRQQSRRIDSMRQLLGHVQAQLHFKVPSSKRAWRRRRRPRSTMEYQCLPDFQIVIVVSFV